MYINYILATLAGLLVLGGTAYVVAPEYVEKMGIVWQRSASQDMSGTGGAMGEEYADGSDDGEENDAAHAAEGGEEGYVLEYDAESADECEVGDVFNEERMTCEYVCESEAECKQLAQEAEDELAAWGDEYEKDTGPVAEPTSKNGFVGEDAGATGGSSEDNLSATYTVRSDESIALKTGKKGTKDAEVWEKVAALSPDTFTAQFIETYGVFSDAQSDTLAYVHDDDGNGKWQVVVNLAGYESSTERERSTTLIHELGHIVTLNSKQVNTGVDENGCPRPAFYTGEGCARQGAYIAKFVDSFWDSADLAAVGGGAGDNGEAATSLYERKSNAFVTDYAATNPGEDIAESFALFILDLRNPAPQTVAERKVTFFYQFPDLVSFRADMRKALVTGIVRARRESR